MIVPSRRNGEGLEAGPPPLLEPEALIMTESAAGDHRPEGTGQLRRTVDNEVVGCEDSASKATELKPMVTQVPDRS